MAVLTFPNTPVIDNFNRPNEGPPPSPNWTNDGDYAGQWKVSSNTCVPDGTVGGSENEWNSTIFGPDCEVYLTLATKMLDSFQVEIYARMQPSDRTSSYMLRATAVAAATDTIL